MHIKVSGCNKVVLAKKKDKHDPTKEGELNKINPYNTPTQTRKQSGKLRKVAGMKSLEMMGRDKT